MTKIVRWVVAGVATADEIGVTSLLLLSAHPQFQIYYFHFTMGCCWAQPNCTSQWVRQTLAHAGSSRHAVMHSTYSIAQQHAKSSFQKAYTSQDDFDVLQLYYDAPKWFFLISLLGIYWICWMILVSFIVSGKFSSHNVARYFLCFILSYTEILTKYIYYVYIYIYIYIYTHTYTHPYMYLTISVYSCYILICIWYFSSLCLSY